MAHPQRRHLGEAHAGVSEERGLDAVHPRRQHALGHDAASGIVSLSRGSPRPGD